ncbi:MAG: hypothetical protein M1826_002020 [Phylliscum demangeonii]|nr:MAG: hypothetical protein M1826_002020 [Phylliscum demangeonii]
MTPDQASPPTSPRTPLSLDLSSVPPFIAPTPPSNTLLITNLIDREIFRPDNLQTVRDLIHETATIHSWSPLRCFRRIVVSFYDVDDAIRMRQVLDGEAIMGERMRVYFGGPTPIMPVDQHLKAPASQKMFFISPPPSPPHGWEMRDEAPPNTQVHAEDLVQALSRLHARSNHGPLSGLHERDGSSRPEAAPEPGRRRASSVMIYHPADHGDSPALPAIAVEDLTAAWDEIASPAELGGAPTAEKILHTSRPPVELMEDA